MMRSFRSFNHLYPTEKTMTQEPSLKDLAEFRHTKRAEKAALTKEYDAACAEIDAIVEGLDELISDLFPEGVDTQSVTFSDGSKASITKKKNAQFRLNAGESDTYYAWAAANGRTDLFQKRIAQDAMTTEVTTRGLPPGVFVHSETVINMTVKRPAPTV
jgi:hypothetical protein